MEPIRQADMAAFAGGGANFFAPLVEQHLAENLRISHALYDISRMRPVAELLRPNA